MSPKEKAKELFNKIRYMDNESGNDCTTCDCVVLPIAKFICDEFINEHSFHNPDRMAYWLAVKVDLERL